MFIEFFYALRAGGLKVTPTELLTLLQALAKGHARSSLSVFYHLSRAILVKSETQYDNFDRVFAEFFEGVDQQFELNEDILRWLENPTLPRELTEEERAQLRALDLATLREEFEKRLREQKERHDGGSHWVGTGGTSPFGSGGTNPAGVRVGSGGGRTAAQVAGDRRYRNLRSDRVLDTRQMGLALRRLRKLAKDSTEEIDIPKTIDTSARNAGDIELVFGPARKNNVKLCLLMDIGGSMDPHSELCERLFSAAHAHNHFKAFKHFYFHNCPYDRLYSNFELMKSEATKDVLKILDPSWFVIVVGDAYMHPYELSQVGGAINYDTHNPETGLWWLQTLRARCPRSVWLNPEPTRIWDAASVRTIRSVFPMFELTLDGLGQAVAMLRGNTPNVASGERLYPPAVSPWG